MWAHVYVFVCRAVNSGSQQVGNPSTPDIWEWLGKFFNVMAEVLCANGIYRVEAGVLLNIL